MFLSLLVYMARVSFSKLQLTPKSFPYKCNLLCCFSQTCVGIEIVTKIGKYFENVKTR